MSDRPEILDLIFSVTDSGTQQAILDWEATEAFWSRGVMAACFGDATAIDALVENSRTFLEESSSLALRLSVAPIKAKP